MQRILSIVSYWPDHRIISYEKLRIQYETLICSILVLQPTGFLTNFCVHHFCFSQFQDMFKAGDQGIINWNSISNGEHVINAKNRAPEGEKRQHSPFYLALKVLIIVLTSIKVILFKKIRHGIIGWCWSSLKLWCHPEYGTSVENHHGESDCELCMLVCCVVVGIIVCRVCCGRMPNLPVLKV